MAFTKVARGAKTPGCFYDGDFVKGSKQIAPILQGSVFPYKPFFSNQMSHIILLVKAKVNDWQLQKR
jgi:hypothetical protein